VITDKGFPVCDTIVATHNVSYAEFLGLGIRVGFGARKGAGTNCHAIVHLSATATIMHS
jgi:hypothetical protein